MASYSILWERDLDSASRRLFDENDRLYYKNFYSYTLDFYYNGLYNIIQMPDIFYNSKEDTKMTKKKATQKATEKTVSASKATEATEKIEKKPVAIKPCKSQKAVEYMMEVIQSQEVTRKALVEMTTAKFPELAKSTITTILSDGKNPKYNRYFPTLLTADENQILKFR